MLEVRQVQAQQVPEHLATQHRVHAVPRMQDQILAKPPHRRVEEEEHPEAHGDRDQSALGLMHHDLVDHHLGAERRGEADQLDEERGGEHVAPDALVLEEFGPEPAKAELRLHRRAVACRRFRRVFAPDQDHGRRKLLLERSDRRRLRRLAAGDEIKQPFRIPLDEDRRPRRLAREKPYTGKRRLRELAFTGAKTQRVRRLDELLDRMRRGKALQEQRGVERHPVDLANAADQPGKVRLSNRCPQLDCHALPLRGD